MSQKTNAQLARFQGREVNTPRDGRRLRRKPYESTSTRSLGSATYIRHNNVIVIILLIIVCVTRKT